MTLNPPMKTQFRVEFIIQEKGGYSSRALSVRVKSGNFGHEVNSDIHLQTLEIKMRRLLMSRLIRIFIVCLDY